VSLRIKVKRLLSALEAERRRADEAEEKFREVLLRLKAERDLTRAIFAGRYAVDK